MLDQLQGAVSTYLNTVSGITALDELAVTTDPVYRDEFQTVRIQLHQAATMRLLDSLRTLASSVRSQCEEPPIVDDGY